MSIAIFLNRLLEEFTTWVGGLEAQMETLTIEDIYTKYRLEAKRLLSRGGTTSTGFKQMAPGQLKALQVKASPKSTLKKRFAIYGTYNYCNKSGYYYHEYLKQISDERHKANLKEESSSAGMAVYTCRAMGGTGSLKYWIMDSGTSDHMAPN
jgi:hypothetical protein